MVKRLNRRIIRTIEKQEEWLPVTSFQIFGIIFLYLFGYLINPGAWEVLSQATFRRQTIQLLSNRIDHIEKVLFAFFLHSR